jgi:2-dehydro-3-deoxyphosphogluconate aldolase / (4S)-4-hydroxy-2-oxoglutarate aldolase
MTARDAIGRILRDGYILVFNQDKLDVVRTAEALLEAGLGNMEVTCRIKQPLEKMRRLKSELPEMVVGAASLIDSPGLLATYNAAHADDPLPSIAECVDAGADYLVSAANFLPETFERFAGKVGMMPGCGTVTEIATQFGLGANLVKIFPAKQLGGPAFIKAVDAPLHKIVPIVPTGGTNASNIPDYVAAGVLAVGGSFSAIDKDTFARIVAEQDYATLAAELKTIKALIDEARAAQWPALDFATATPEDIAAATGRQFNLDR